MNKFLSRNKQVKLNENDKALIFDAFLDFIEYKEPSGRKRLFLSTWFFVLSWFLIIPGIILYIYRTKIDKQIIEKVNKKYYDFIASWFDKLYSDLKLVGIPSDNIIDLVFNNPGVGIPGHANISNWSVGYTFETAQKVNINLVSVKWSWLKEGVNLKQDVIYGRKIYAIIGNLHARWNNFEFDIFPDNAYSKKSDSLAQMEFNKKWIYKYNDEIKLRQLLSALTQEKLINLLKNKKESIGSYLEVSKNTDFVLVSMDYPLTNNPFALNFTGLFFNLTSKKAIAKTMVHKIYKSIDTINDILYAVSIFKNIL